MELDRDLLARQEVRSLVAQAKQAQAELKTFSQEKIDGIVKAIADCGAAHAEELGKLAQEETGFGRAADKAIKNQFAASTVWQAIAPIHTVGILAQDPAAKTYDVGVPVGVIAGIVPSTNPTSTIIYKAQIALKGGNTIVFSPHPGAKRCCMETAKRIAQAAEAAGCPRGAIGCISDPSMEAVNELMHHNDIRLILATGGGAMVRAAYSSGRPAIGVGAGNGPAYIHRSADIPKAVKDIITSKTFDNGTICASEQSIILEASIADQVKEELTRQGCYFLSTEEASAVAKLLLRPNGTINPEVVGKTAHAVAAMAGLERVPADTKVLIAREQEAGPTRPYSREKLCPVLAYFIEENEDQVLQKVCQVLELEGRGHTFVIHAQDEAVIRRFALQVPVSRFLVNTPAALGGIGATTNLFPALTLGCGAVGGSSSSNNIGPLDLINIRRVAWGVRDILPSSGQTKPAQASVDEKLIAQLTEQILKKLQ